MHITVWLLTLIPPIFYWVAILSQILSAFGKSIARTIAPVLKGTID